MYPQPQANADPWLQRWLKTICEHADTSAVLELGCGDGSDTASLTAAGLRVVAVDLAADAIERARAAVPGAEFHVGDVRDDFPLAAAQVIVASLSLHYFDWPETCALISRIHATLGSRGLFIGRFNSTNDHNFGASGYPRIDTNYYLVRGMRKRFFDRAGIDALFTTGWQNVSIEELTTNRYGKAKIVWEVVVEKR